jgi:8-oxo-dGTP pyrophosphatase MutT (NUDIX family)
MNKETSSGAIVFCTQSETTRFLLVLSAIHNTWGFPKGHIETGETELDAAKREIFEETGIDCITFIDGFRQEDVYLTEGALPENKGKTVEKHSIYYLAKTNNTQLTARENEIKKAQWFSYDEAKNILPHENQKIFLEKALTTINKLP